MGCQHGGPAERSRGVFLPKNSSRQSRQYLRKICTPSRDLNKENKDSDYKIRMEHILDETVPAEDLKKFEQKYHEELQHGKVSSSSQFEYAWCLVRSRYPADIGKGIILLEDLYQVEPGNRQAQELEVIASKRLEKDGMVGMAVAGGAAVALGGLVGLGIALAGRQMMKK